MRVVKWLIAAVVLMVLVIAALPFVIPVETYRNEITARVREATGRDLIIKGPMRASVFPVLGVHAEQVSFSNGKGYAAANMAEIKALDIKLALMPLLSGNVELKGFLLDTPVISLEVDKNGVPNWQFGAKTAAPAKPAEKKAAAGEPVWPMKRLKLEQVEIKNGTLEYRDARTGKEQKFTGFNVKTKLDGMDQPLNFTADTTLNGEQIRVNGTIDSPEALNAGKSAKAALKVDSNVMQLIYNGALSPSALNGTVELGVPSLVKLAKWNGSAMEWKGATPLAFGVKGNAVCNPGKCKVSDAVIVLDAIRLTGELGAQFSGNVPNVVANLSADALDITPYMPQQQAYNDNWIISDAYAQGAYSTDKLDMSALRAVNADVRIKTGSFTARNIKLGAMSVLAKLNNGALSLDIPQAEAYGGQAAVNLHVTSAAVPSVSTKLNLKNINAEALLSAVSQFDRLSGTLQFTLDARTQGVSIAQWVEALAGSGSLRLTDGALKGVNLAQLVRNAKSALTGGDTSAQKTDFSELAGTFGITNGIVRNNDLGMKAPLIRLGGSGTVDLPRQYVNYVLKPSLVTSIEGQGGADMQGLLVPVIVEGPWSALTFRPDLAAAATDALQNPEKVRATAKEVRDTIRENKETLKDMNQIKDLQKPENVEKIKGLIEGLGR